MPNQKILLLNASNKEDFPVYPYAFIQVPAVARQVGIDVVCKDLLGIPQGQWKQIIKTMIEQHSPVLILITLRNTDALVAQEYELNGAKEEKRSVYFPIEQTRELINAVREISDLKITVGGFGFSLLPNELMRYLHPDFGVVGGPDDFFAHFEDILNGNPDKVASLLFFRKDQLISNPRVLYPPFSGAEYTPQVIKEMMEFYTAFPSPGFQGAPVEIMRGCNHSCLFCAEPHSAGRQVRYRDLSAVMKDIEMLSDHGVIRIYIISSELNPEGNEFVLELADRIHSFNEAQSEGRKITWYGANYLLKFGSDEYEQLYRSGFTGGWFDITALDDENARAMRTPYQNRLLLIHLKTYAEYARRQIDLRRAQKALETEAKVSAGDGREDELVRWSIFLGNLATTIQTIRNTIQIANREGLSSLFDSCGIISCTRIFDYEEPTEAVLEATYSVSTELKRVSYQQLLPSFACPPELLKEFSEKEISEMFGYIGDTCLSKKYQQTRDWLGFINQWATAESISRWMSELSNEKETPVSVHLEQVTDIHGLFGEKPQADELHSDMNLVARDVTGFLLSACLRTFPEFFESLGLPTTAETLDQMTPYELATMVFNRWEREEELLEQARSVSPEWKRDVLCFCIQAMLYRFNVLIKPQYSQLFMAEFRDMNSRDEILK
jgi:hypothetical protein